ncbi:MAG TPA: CinA family protein [Devosia sp.]|nr:CinA family protein [Devosia sp.]
MKMPADVATLATDIIKRLKAKGWTIAAAESCTGGLIAGALTSIPGSSDAVYGGFVTYANEAKITMVGVPYGTLREFGAVSKEVAVAMAEGALAAAGTHVAIAVTGIAGPDGGSAEKPVGLVHFALATMDATHHLRRNFNPGWTRDDIRHAAVIEALKLIAKSI